MPEPIQDASDYSIKFTATRKKEDNMKKQKKNLELKDAITLLELDNGHDKQTTNELIDKVNTLRQTIQAQADFEEQEAAKRFMANNNLQAKTPTNPPKPFATR